MLTDNHKTKQMGSALKLLTRNAQGEEFLDSIVTGDKTWGFHHTPKSKQQSLQWRHTHSRMTQRTSHLDGLWIGAANSKTSHPNKTNPTNTKRARLTSKGYRSTRDVSLLPRHNSLIWRKTTQYTLLSICNFSL
jgi:hypothetical protein